MRYQMIAPAVLIVLATIPGPTRAQSRGAPEVFTANLQVSGATDAGGAAAATIQMDVQRYKADADRAAVESALKSGGHSAFLTALRKAPAVGAVSFGDQKWTIRWAREQTNPKGRTIVLVTDQPVFFVGGGRADPKPRAGYEVAVIQIQIDDGREREARRRVRRRDQRLRRQADQAGERRSEVLIRSAPFRDGARRSPPGRGAGSRAGRAARRASG